MSEDFRWSKTLQTHVHLLCGSSPAPGVCSSPVVRWLSVRLICIDGMFTVRPLSPCASAPPLFLCSSSDRLLRGDTVMASLAPTAGGSSDLAFTLVITILPIGPRAGGFGEACRDVLIWRNCCDSVTIGDGVAAAMGAVAVAGDKPSAAAADVSDWGSNSSISSEMLRSSSSSVLACGS